ncbi:MAG: glycosyltransferase, partial [Treponema sp.]|nr:glycosyltransferase [Treponema sp.]
MKAAFAIPVYRHGRPLANVVRGLIPYAIPIIVVDDGNEGEERDLVQSVASLSALVKVIRLKKNMGKGAAVNVAARTACEMG